MGCLFFSERRSPTHNLLHLPVLTCSYCQRKLGLWSFHQIQEAGAMVEGDDLCTPSTLSTPGLGLDGRGGDEATPSSLTPSRMTLRSQDATRPEQEGPMHRHVFDPLGRRRDWCPWVSTGKGHMQREASPTDPQIPSPETSDPQLG